MPRLDPELLAMLVCPLSKAALVLHESTLVSTDRATRRSYDVVDGIPDLLVDHSRELELSRWEEIMKAVHKI